MDENKKKIVLSALSVLFAMSFLSANALTLSESAFFSDTSTHISAEKSEDTETPASDAGDRI